MKYSIIICADDYTNWLTLISKLFSVFSVILDYDKYLLHSFLTQVLQFQETNLLQNEFE